MPCIFNWLVSGCSAQNSLRHSPPKRPDRNAQEYAARLAANGYDLAALGALTDAEAREMAEVTFFFSTARRAPPKKFSLRGSLLGSSFDRWQSTGAIVKFLARGKGGTDRDWKRRGHGFEPWDGSSLCLLC